MPNYMFSFGNSTDGSIGAVMRVIAPDKDAALATIREVLEANWPGGTNDRLLRPLDEQGNRDQRVEYFNVYFNPEKITLADIDEGETEDEDGDGETEDDDEEGEPKEGDE